MLGALWSTSGCTLATLGRSVSALWCSLAASGSDLGSLGGHSAPKGSTRDPLHPATGRGEVAGNVVLLTAESRRPRAKCHRPWALGHSPWAISAMGHCAESRERNAMGLSGQSRAPKVDSAVADSAVAESDRAIH